jgi:hypothetical protein
MSDATAAMNDATSGERVRSRQKHQPKRLPEQRPRRNRLWKPGRRLLLSEGNVSASRSFPLGESEILARDALKNLANVQFATERFHVDCFALESQRRVARDHEGAADSGQVDSSSAIIFAISHCKCAKD